MKTRNVAFVLFLWNSMIVLTATATTPSLIKDLTCDFDQGNTCGWTLHGDNPKWIISSASGSQSNRFLTASSQNGATGEASIESHFIPGRSYYCFSLYWASPGQSAVNFTVFKVLKNLKVTEYQSKGLKFPHWRILQVSFAAAQDFKILIKCEQTDGNGQINVDNIQLTTGKCQSEDRPVIDATSTQRSIAIAKRTTVSGKISSVGQQNVGISKLTTVAQRSVGISKRSTRTPRAVTETVLFASTSSSGSGIAGVGTVNSFGSIPDNGPVPGNNNSTCDFNSGDICGWTNDRDNLGWNITDGKKFGVVTRTGKPGNMVTTMGEDHVKGVATLTSPLIAGGSYKCLVFYLLTSPEHSVDLIVYKKLKNLEVPKINTRRKNFPEWTRMQATMASLKDYQIKIESIQYSGTPGQVFLDDIRIVDGKCPHVTSTLQPTTSVQPTAKAEKQEAREAEPWKVGIGVGVGVLVVVVAVALTVACYRRTRRYKNGNVGISQVVQDADDTGEFQNPIYSYVHNNNNEANNREAQYENPIYAQVNKKKNQSESSITEDNPDIAAPAHPATDPGLSQTYYNIVLQEQGEEQV